MPSGRVAKVATRNSRSQGCYVHDFFNRIGQERSLATGATSSAGGVGHRGLNRPLPTLLSFAVRTYPDSVECAAGALSASINTTKRFCVGGVDGHGAP